MKTNYLMGLALAGLGLVSGCIIIDRDCWKSKQPPSSPPPVIHRDTVMTEIEAVCKLGIESNRSDLLIQIAGRPHLSPPIQVRLVEVGMDRLGIESNRADLLMTLANNPCLSEEGVRAILGAVDRLGIESNRRDVLEAIGNRQIHPPMPGPIPVPCGPIPVPEIPPQPQPCPH